MIERRRRATLPQRNDILGHYNITTMSSGIRAFSRSRVLLGPGRADVDIAMTKWWAKKRPAEGQVRQSYMTISARILRIALML
jgi:hypothetical protein